MAVGRGSGGDKTAKSKQMPNTLTGRLSVGEPDDVKICIYILLSSK